MYIAIARRVLAGIFGDNSWLALLVLPIIFWPIIAFWNYVSFNPAAFTEEWIKFSITGLLIAFLLELIHIRTEIYDAQYRLHHFVADDIIPLIASIASSLNCLTVSNRTREMIVQCRLCLHSSWTALRSHIDRLRSISDSYHHTTYAFALSIPHFDSTLCDNIITSILASPDPGMDIPAEIAQLHQMLSAYDKAIHTSLLNRR